MKSFLEYVAKDIIERYGNNLSKVAVVFPNKRASIFLNEHLAQHSSKPVWSPTYITISELFRKHSDYVVPDQIKLISDLHKCFLKCTGIDESLDHFYGWGQLMLADFDDIDKNMADAKQVFANIRDIHEYDDISYLTEEQKTILKRFFSNFSDDKNTELKQRFLNIWSRFFDIYTSYNSMLKENGYAYEGALYRDVATDEKAIFEYDKYLFVGFNMTQAVEKKLFDRLKKQGKAEFYWDFDNFYTHVVKGQHHEAGHYIRENLHSYPCSLDTSNNDIYNNFCKKKQITFISASTEDIQARFVGNWLKENERYKEGRKTAVVMCNEGLMQTVLHSLPENIGPINITTGYPLQQTPIASFVKQLITLRCDGYSKTRNRFILSIVNRVLKHPYMPYITDNYSILLNEINNDARVYYPTSEQLSKDDALSLVFSNPYNYKDNQTFESAMIEWLLNIVKLLAENTQDIDDPLFKESVFKAYTLINRLSALISSGDLNVNRMTLQGLIDQLIQSTSIPFHGEPAEGIQIMGVLETRNLDFDNLLILSCNEGNMPKGVNDSSFIPYSIRKAFGLTTVDNKVAIYAYYFYRLIQRAENVTVLYNNATTDGNKNEMSRFMMQLMVESGHNIEKKALCIGLEPQSSETVAIEKSDAIMERLIERFKKTPEHTEKPLLTPSSINMYLRCPLRFYYNYVCGIKEPDLNDEDKIDGRIFGNIFHRASQIVYEKLTDGNGWIEPERIRQTLKSSILIERAVDKAFNEEVFKSKAGNTPDYDGLQLINREVVIIYLRRLLENDMKLGAFNIIGLEKTVNEEWQISTPNHCFTTSLGGFIDRLDMVNTDLGMGIRVVDYKTGKYKLEKFADFNELFMTKSIARHSDYFIQTMLYSKIVRDSKYLNPKGLTVSPALLFIQQSIENSDDIILKLGGEKITDIERYKADFIGHLNTVITEIFDSTKAFEPTEHRERCQQCPYSAICNV
ncbi:MAG: PD-(D/E)XK nuclease family protein [Prevotella sp.]|nr:PD-(D/E)XK nuclease family protein [Prevotella sp.]